MILLCFIYNSLEVQRFLNGLPVKQLQSSKEIYQHGTLRKVTNSFSIMPVAITIIMFPLSCRNLL